MKRLVLIAAFVIVNILAAQTAWTEKKVLSFFENSNDPINIESDKSITRIIPDGHETVFLGNVRASQGFLSLKCNELSLEFNESKAKGKAVTRNRTNPGKRSFNFGKLRFAIATGNVIVKYNDTMASSDKLEYDHKKRTIVFSGKTPKTPPKMWQGSNLMVGKIIAINLGTNTVTITKPRMDLVPNEKHKDAQ